MTTEVLITGALHSSVIDSFKKDSRFKIDYHPDCSREELLSLLPSAQILITRSETDVDKPVIDAAPNLKVIARAAVGVGNIDIDYATSRGILVVNCPGKNTNSAAELSFGLLLNMFRNLPQAHSQVKAGGWDRHRFTGRELRGKVIGIVGLGNVGHRVAKFAHGFDMKVLAYDPYVSPQVFQRNGALACETLEELADQVDILTVHVPLNRETKGMVNKDILLRLPKGAYILNAARGGVIVEADLFAALESGHLAGAAIDTWETEPKPLPELAQHPRVWTSPHIGASTEEAQLAIGESVYSQVVKAVEGGVVDHPVNLPNVGVIDNPLLKTYATLAEKLGSLCGQLLSFNPSSLSINYRGDLASLDHSLVRLTLMKGYAQQVVDGYVSFVNVDSHFNSLGITVEERSDPDFEAYRSAIKASIRGADGRELTVGGVVFDTQYSRMTLIQDFYFEIEPAGNFLFVENDDVPGVIGDVGHFLASRGVNIDSFDLSRNRKGGRAMAIIKTDSLLDQAGLKAMGEIANVKSVNLVLL